jgi:hypothetical protein
LSLAAVLLMPAVRHTKDVLVVELEAGDIGVYLIVELYVLAIPRSSLRTKQRP